MKNNNLCLLSLLMLAVLGGCVSRSAALDDYRYDFRANPSLPTKNTTVVCMVFDGLSPEILEKALLTGKIPALKGYFLRNGETVHRGRSGFPSTTYPNIASILTASPIGVHPIIGNQMRLDGDFVNFEKPKYRTQLNAAITAPSIFTELTQRNLKSVSLAHYFRAGATVHYHTDLEAGLSYLAKDYAPVDDKLLDSLQILLSSTPSAEWPFFIFLHVAGVDSVAHDLGPESPEVVTTLSRLDEKLSPIFALLESAEEQGKRVTVLLTADHGFMSFRKFFDIDRYVSTKARGTKVLNETRYASLYFPSGNEDVLRSRIEKSFVAHPEIGQFVQRSGSQIKVMSSSTTTLIDYVTMECPATEYGLKVNAGDAACPEAFDLRLDLLPDPYFIPHIAAYFHSPHRPHALLFAAPGVSFAANQKGGHGGASAEEVLVPILLHNARIHDETKATPTHELLRPMYRE